MDNTGLSKKLDDYLALRDSIFEYFEYKEDWVVIPIEDRREAYWHLLQCKAGNGFVYYHPEKEIVEKRDGRHYQNSIYTQRFLDKWVYEKEDFTMICVDTHCDQNKFLAIYDNSKRV